MKKLGFLCLSVASCSLHANVIQYFTGISYSNPSELFKVQKNELIFGGTGFATDGRFVGTVLNFNTGNYDGGVSHSKTASLLPFGRIAKRFNDKIVLGIDVTQPFHSNLVWGNEQSFTRYAVTHNLLTDTDFNAKLSYSVNQRLHLGAGFNLNFLKNNEVNFVLPSGPTTYSTLINRTTGLGTGFNAGLTFGLTQMDFLGATYYSRIKQRTAGFSRFNGLLTNDHTFTFNMPATSVFSYTHLFNPQWLVNLNAFYVQWDANQYVRLFNTAYPQSNNFVFPMLFHASWAYLGVVREQHTEKLGLSLIGVLDNGPERENLRTLVFPSDRQYFIGLSADYKYSETTTLQATYGHGFSRTRLANSVTVNGFTFPFTTGDVDLSAEVLELRLTVRT